METLTSGGSSAPREPAPLDPVQLGSDASPAGHPCASTDLYGPDLALLHYLLQDLRVVARNLAAGSLHKEPYDEVTWSVHDLARRTVICDPQRLATPGDVCMVGFLGNRRSSDEAALVDVVELDVIGEFRSYPGIISYSSIELLENQWANLVVHAQPDDRDAWRHSQVHIQAAEDVAPLVYHSVRIHNGTIPGGPIGSGTIRINSTKYWDYDSEPMWHAQRVLPEPTHLQASDQEHEKLETNER